MSKYEYWIPLFGPDYSSNWIVWIIRFNTTTTLSHQFFISSFYMVCFWKHFPFMIKCCVSNNTAPPLTWPAQSVVTSGQCQGLWQPRLTQSFLWLATSINSPRPNVSSQGPDKMSRDRNILIVLLCFIFGVSWGPYQTMKFMKP